MLGQLLMHDDVFLALVSEESTFQNLKIICVTVYSTKGTVFTMDLFVIEGCALVCKIFRNYLKHS